MEDTINIILADDHELFRAGLMYLLEKEPAFSIIHQADSGDALLKYLATNKAPDIILLDLNMPGTNGVEATKIIKKKHPDVKVIALTSYYSDSFINNMLEYGAGSFLSKDTPANQLVHAIKEVHLKGYYYNEDILRIISNKIQYGSRKKLSRFDKSHLSNRETDVLKLICRQLTTAEIAEKLFISYRTVEWHRNNLLAKTDSKNMIGLLVYALENNLMSIDELLLPGQ